MNGADTVVQQWEHVTDSVDLFAEDTFKSGDGLSSDVLVKKLAADSASAIGWLLAEPFNLNLTGLVQLGGHSTKRTHRFKPTAEGKPLPVGYTIVNALKTHATTKLSDRITVMSNTRVVDITFDKTSSGRRVTGVVYELPFMGNDQHTLTADAVVMAAGGYAYGDDNLAKGLKDGKPSILLTYAPALVNFPTTNGPWATGDLIHVAKAHDLKLVHLDKVQIHPTGFVNPSEPAARVKFLAPEAMRGVGGILVNHKGERFVNELGRRDDVTAAIMERSDHLFGDLNNPVSTALLLSTEMVDAFGSARANFYRFKKLIHDFQTVADAAAFLKVKPDVLSKTISDYNSLVKAGAPDKFKKSVYPAALNGETISVALVTPSLHYCMGGVAFNENAQVLANDGSLVSGLYAAGEVTGGLHGENRLGGNSLLECVVYGRVAGRSAATAGIL